MGFGLFCVDHAVVVVLNGVLEGVLDIVDVNDVLRLVEGDSQRRANDLFELVTVNYLIRIGIDDIQVGCGFHNGLGNILDTVIIVVHGVLELILDVIDADDVVCRSGGDGQRLAFDLVELVAIDDLVGVGVNDILEGSGVGFGLFCVDHAVVVVLNGVLEGILDVINVDDIGGCGSRDFQRSRIMVQLVAVDHFVRICSNDSLEFSAQILGFAGIQNAVVVITDGIGDLILDVVHTNDVAVCIGADRDTAGGRIGGAENVTGLRLRLVGNACAESSSAVHGFGRIKYIVVVILDGVAVLRSVVINIEHVAAGSDCDGTGCRIRMIEYEAGLHAAKRAHSADGAVIRGLIGSGSGGILRISCAIFVLIEVIDGVIVKLIGGFAVNNEVLSRHDGRNRRADGASGIGEPAAEGKVGLFRRVAVSSHGLIGIIRILMNLFAVHNIRDRVLCRCFIGPGTGEDDAAGYHGIARLIPAVECPGTDRYAVHRHINGGAGRSFCVNFCAEIILVGVGGKSCGDACRNTGRGILVRHAGLTGLGVGPGTGENDAAGYHGIVRLIPAAKRPGADRYAVHRHINGGAGGGFCVNFCPKIILVGVGGKSCGDACRNTGRGILVRHAGFRRFGVSPGTGEGDTAGHHGVARLIPANKRPGVGHNIFRIPNEDCCGAGCGGVNGGVQVIFVGVARQGGHDFRRQVGLGINMRHNALAGCGIGPGTGKGDAALCHGDRIRGPGGQRPGAGFHAVFHDIIGRADGRSAGNQGNRCANQIGAAVRNSVAAACGGDCCGQRAGCRCVSIGYAVGRELVVIKLQDKRALCIDYTGKNVPGVVTVKLIACVILGSRGYFGVRGTIFCVAIRAGINTGTSLSLEIMFNDIFGVVLRNPLCIKRRILGDDKGIVGVIGSAASIGLSIPVAESVAGAGKCSVACNRDSGVHFVLCTDRGRTGITDAVRVIDQVDETSFKQCAVNMPTVDRRFNYIPLHILRIRIIGGKNSLNLSGVGNCIQICTNGTFAGRKGGDTNDICNRNAGCIFGSGVVTRLVRDLAIFADVEGAFFVQLGKNGIQGNIFRNGEGRTLRINELT